VARGQVLNAWDGGFHRQGDARLGQERGTGYVAEDNPKTERVLGK